MGVGRVTVVRVVTVVVRVTVVLLLTYIKGPLRHLVPPHSPPTVTICHFQFHYKYKVIMFNCDYSRQ